MLEPVTFLLAVIGYAGLTITAVLASLRRLPTGLWRAVVPVIATHVALVWAIRYEWSFAEATRNGYVGFAVFHGALALIVASLFLSERLAGVLVRSAFAIVSLGAIGAVFRYEIVAGYRWVVIAIAIVGAAGVGRGLLLRRRRAIPSV